VSHKLKMQTNGNIYIYRIKIVIIKGKDLPFTFYDILWHIFYTPVRIFDNDSYQCIVHIP
jgi:hypothetical protein